MIPASTRYELQTFGGGEVGRCTMTNVAHMQQLVLTMGYQDKLVFVRELIHNAVDSMLRAYKADVPILVHFPDAAEPVFWVRDYGVGMSHQRFLEVYADLGSSDKRDEAISTGALGIGSKSPLVYADAFNVQCFDGEYVRTYVIGWGDDGCVTYQAHPPVACDEPTGVLVAVPIKAEDEDNIFRRILTVCSKLNHPHVRRVAVPNAAGQLLRLDGPLSDHVNEYQRDEAGLPVDGRWDAQYRSVSPYVWLRGSRFDDLDKDKPGLFKLQRSDASFGTIDAYMGRVVYKLDVEQLVADLPHDEQQALNMLGLVQREFRLCIPADADNGRCPVTFDAGRERLQLSEATIAWVYPALLAAAEAITEYYNQLFAGATTHAKRLAVLLDNDIPERASKYLLQQLPSVNGGPTGAETLLWLKNVGKYLPGINPDRLRKDDIRCQYNFEQLGWDTVYSDQRGVPTDDRRLTRLVTGFTPDHTLQKREYLKLHRKLKALPLILVDDRNQWKKRTGAYTSGLVAEANAGRAAAKAQSEADGDAFVLEQAEESVELGVFSFIGRGGQPLTDEQVQTLIEMIGDQYDVVRTSEMPKVSRGKVDRKPRERRRFSWLKCYRFAEGSLNGFNSTAAYVRITESQLSLRSDTRPVVLQLEGNSVHLLDGKLPCNSTRVDRVRSSLRRLYNEVTQVAECEDLMLSDGEILLYRKTEVDEDSLPGELVRLSDELTHISKSMYEVAVWAKVHDILFDERYSRRRFAGKVYLANLAVAGTPLATHVEFFYRFDALATTLNGLREYTLTLLNTCDYSRCKQFEAVVNTEAARLAVTFNEELDKLQAAFPMFDAIRPDFDWRKPVSQWYRDQLAALHKKKSYVRTRDLPELPKLPGKLEGEYFAGLRSQGYLGAKRSPRKTKCRQMTLTSS